MKKKKICLAVLAAVFFITAPTQIQVQAETVAVETVINTGQETKTSDILDKESMEELEWFPLLFRCRRIRIHRKP